MNSHLLDVRNQQQESWNSFAPGWKVWDDFTMRFLKTQGDQIIDHLDLKPNDRVLDIATGTGEPGLTIAAIVHQGSVTAVDLSERMLQIAHEKAKAKSADNFQTLVADVCELPFEDASFDAVSCRLGFMFFPDMQLAANEILRVLKPGGRLAVTVWGESARNVWITALLGTMKRYVEVPTPGNGAPGMFRCAQPGFMTSLFGETGLQNAEEIAIDGYLPCNSMDEYWSFMNDVVPPVVSGLKCADRTIIGNIKHEVYDLLEKHGAENRKGIAYGARLFKATKRT